MFGVSFVFIPAHQVRTNLCDTLTFLRDVKVDSIVLVSMPANPKFSPQPHWGKYLTLLPISGDPDIDRGPLHKFATATLPVATGRGMVVT